MLHMCHYCTGEYTDGKVDCENYTCPLYFYMPYGDKDKADLSFLEFNPRLRGHVKFGEKESPEEELDDYTEEELKEVDYE